MFLRRKNRKKEAIRRERLMLKGWELSFVLNERKEGMERFVDDFMRVRVEDSKVFVPSSMCHLVGSGRMTSPVVKFKLVYSEKFPVKLIRNENSKFLVKALTRNGRTYYLYDINMSIDAWNVFLHHGMPREFLPDAVMKY